MATCNFSSRNTSKIFAFGMNKYLTQDDIDCGYRSQENLGEFDPDLTYTDMQCEIGDVMCALEKLGYSEYRKGDVFMTKDIYFTYCGFDFRIEISAKYLVGYYEGASWDYDIVLHLGNWLEYDLCEDFPFTAEMMFDAGWHDNKGFLKMQEKNINNKIEKEKAKLVEEIETVFANNSEEILRVVGRFSNGSALYESVA